MHNQTRHHLLRKRMTPGTRWRRPFQRHGIGRRKRLRPFCGIDPWSTHPCSPLGPFTWPMGSTPTPPYGKLVAYHGTLTGSLLMPGITEEATHLVPPGAVCYRLGPRLPGASRTSRFSIPPSDEFRTAMTDSFPQDLRRYRLLHRVLRACGNRVRVFLGTDTKALPESIGEGLGGLIAHVLCNFPQTKLS